VRRAVGHCRWAVAEGYIPPGSTGRGRALESHETLCILNAGSRDARVKITVYFADRAPAGPYRVVVRARRTRHIRFNDLRRPEPVPKGKDFSSLVESTVPVVVQHTRLDSRQPALALLSTIAFPVD
jgi:hypothetical protein